jgi:hypothetical protein
VNTVRHKDQPVETAVANDGYLFANDMKNIHTKRRKRTCIFNVKHGGKYIYHSALTG